MIVCSLLHQSPRSVRQKSIAAKKKYAEITKELVLKRVDAKHEDDAQRAAQEIKKLQLYTKEEELRRKKMLEMERKRAEAVAMVRRMVWCNLPYITIGRGCYSAPSERAGGRERT